MSDITGNTAEVDLRLGIAESRLGVTLATWQREYAHEYIQAVLGEGELPLLPSAPQDELATLGAVLGILINPSEDATAG